MSMHQPMPEMEMPGYRSETEFIVEPGKQEVVVTRTFDAPRDLVYKTYLDPNLVPKWWGPRNLTTIVDKCDLRKGGLWRIVQRDPQGNEFAFSGVYHEIREPERIIDTFEYEGMPGHVMLETISFEDVGGKTLVTERSVFQSVEDRDGMVETGMREGVMESMDRFAALLERIQRRMAA
jgi:uncharacterized protein YndB with AHSA1/START domain